jgi:hypothetical protein
MARAQNSTGSSWAAPINLSNLSNHQILCAKVIADAPAIVAKSNTTHHVYYTRFNGTIWPAATQLFKAPTTAILSNSGKGAADMGFINGSLCIALSEASSNDIYINVGDAVGSSWQNFRLITDASTTASYPTFVENNGTYLVFNKTTGSPSTKTRIKFTSPTNYIEKNFVTTFNIHSKHVFVRNTEDTNNVMLFAYENNISMLRFYDDDLKINWVATVST